VQSADAAETMCAHAASVAQAVSALRREEMAGTDFSRFGNPILR